MKFYWNSATHVHFRLFCGGCLSRPAGTCGPQSPHSLLSALLQKTWADPRDLWVARINARGFCVPWVTQAHTALGSSWTLALACPSVLTCTSALCTSGHVN